MKFVYSLVVLSCALLGAYGFPYYSGYENVDTYSFGDARRGGMAMSRYYNPYYNPQAAGGSLAAFTVRQPEETQSSQYYLPDRRRQVPQDVNFNIPPQQNEVYYPQQPDIAPLVPTEATELAEPTEKIPEVIPTTAKAVAVPEIIEPEVEEIPEEKPVRKTKTAARRKQLKRPVDEDDEEDDYASKMPAGAFFPMFFGWGGRSGGGPGTAHMAIANAYSTGKGGVATSHATAYGAPRPERS